MPRFRLSLLIALLALLAVAPAAAAAKRMRSIFQDDCLLIQLDADRACRTASRDSTLDTLRDLGADTIKLTVIRDKVQTHGWGAWDAAVQGIVARGMTPLLQVTDRGRTPSVASFVRFVREAVTRYPQVHLWAIYNEPNRRAFLRSASPRAYRGLFVAAEAALRRVARHRRDTVLLGELAPRRTGTRETPIGPLAFTRELFCLDARLRPYRGRTARRRGCASFKRLTADGFGFHPYTNGRGLASPALRERGDGASVITLGRLTQIIDAAARRGRTNRMRIWNTELGFQSNPPDRRAPSLARQAENLNWSDWLQFRNPRVASVSQYDLDDVRANQSYNTGLRFFGGKRRKLAFPAYRMPIFVTRADRGQVRVWGQVRPGRANTVAVQKQVRGRGRFRTVARLRTNPSGYAQRRFRGGTRDLWRLSWRGLTGRIAGAR